MDNDRLNELLLTVQKPGRYVGGEWNAVRKEWNADHVKVLLAFPEVYEIGMSYLGTKILYGILNNRDDSLCERVFAPWPDFEKVLRDNDIPLYSLESRKSMKDFDIVGFSLAYELTYTNVLNMLDLGRIPVRSADRSDQDPIVIAGGPSAFNPEPLADFIDAFVIGEGEDVVGEIIEKYKKQAKAKRATILYELAKIKGVYVPSLYKVEYNADKTISSFLPVATDIPRKIEKRIVADFDNAYYPVDQIVPNISIVHDRLAIEIMRGCKYACRFCQATALYRPCRERSAERIQDIANKGYRSTGYEEISLLSLSSADHSQFQQIVLGLNREFGQEAVSISVPSLRIEDTLAELPELVSKVKKTGLTFAPEAGSQSLRMCVNKNIRIQKLYDAVLDSYRRGWKRVKLYFMIGLPGEVDGDLDSIIDVVNKVSSLKREADGRAAQVTASINAFVPKPHTVFQWEPMNSVEDLARKRSYLWSRIKSKHISLDFHSFEMSLMESAITRADRQAGRAIYEAWRLGSRFDGWREHFDYSRWTAAFAACGIDPHLYASRPRNHDEILPWDYIDAGVKKDLMLRELNNAKALLHSRSV